MKEASSAFELQDQVTSLVYKAIIFDTCGFKVFPPTSFEDMKETSILILSMITLLGLDAFDCAALCSVISMTVAISSTLPAAFPLYTIWTWLGLQCGKLLISQDNIAVFFFIHPVEPLPYLSFLFFLEGWEKGVGDSNPSTWASFLIKVSVGDCA